MMSNQGPPAEPEMRTGRTHLTDVEDGAGCTEIWDHLSERRGSDD